MQEVNREFFPQLCTRLALLSWPLKVKLVIGDGFELMDAQQFLLAVLYSSEVPQWTRTQMLPVFFADENLLTPRPIAPFCFLQNNLWITFSRDLQHLTLEPVNK